MNSRVGLYDQGVVVCNPTKIDTPKFCQAISQIDYLSFSHQFPLKFIYTEENEADTLESIKETAGDHDLLISLGGDGTTKTVAAAALISGLDILSTYAGTANDFSRSLNGKVCGESALSKIVEFGELVKIRPLNVNVQSEHTEEVKSHLAINNAGFNYTAIAAQMLNEAEHRNGMNGKKSELAVTLQLAKTVYGSTKNLTTFDLTDNFTGETRTILDETLVHAAKASKYGNFAISHTEDEFLSISTVHPNKLSVGLAFMQMVLGRSAGVRQTEVDFTTGNSAILGHTDGETYSILPKSRVQATLNNQSFSTYSLLAR